MRAALAIVMVAMTVTNARAETSAQAPTARSKKATCRLTVESKVAFAGVCTVTRRLDKHVAEIIFENESEDQYIIVYHGSKLKMGSFRRLSEEYLADPEQASAPIDEVALDGTCWRGTKMTFCAD